MNLTFSFLHVKNSFSGSYFLTKSQTKSTNSLNFKFLELNRFFSTFLYQKNQNTKITKSTFNKFLKTSIIIDSYKTQYSSEVFYDQLILKSFQATNVADCKFINCVSNDLDGGAILSFGELSAYLTSFF